MGDAKETHDEGDRIACPHGCGYYFMDLWDFDWSGGREEVITECGECGKAVDLYRRVDVSYTARTGGS